MIQGLFLRRRTEEASRDHRILWLNDDSSPLRRLLSGVSSLESGDAAAAAERTERGWINPPFAAESGPCLQYEPGNWIWGSHTNSYMNSSSKRWNVVRLQMNRWMNLHEIDR